MPARILIVEDEAVVAKDIERMLIKQGHSVIGSTASGESAIEIAEKTTIDLALMDIQLQGSIDGIETAQQFKSRFNIPVVFLTAHSDEDTVHSAEKTYPYGFIIKPVDERELLATIRVALQIVSAEVKQRKAQIQFQTIFNTSRDGIWITENGYFIDVNQAFCRLSGYSRDEILAMHISQFEAIETPEQTDRHIAAVQASGWDRFETQHIQKDGSRIDVEISVSYIPQLNRMISFIRDISERKQAENEILTLNQDLMRRSDEMMSLYQAERSQRELAETLVAASREIISTLDIESVLDLIMNQIGRIIQYDICSIVLIEGSTTRVLRSRGYEDFNPTSFIETYVFPLNGQSIRSQIIASKKPLVVPDIRHDDQVEISPRTAWLRSYIAVPIEMLNQVVGLINVGISIPDFYQQWHASRLQAFAYQAAIALQNARLYEEMKQTAGQLEALSRRLLDIQETERRRVARELHDEIGQALTAVQLRVEGLKQARNLEELKGELDECTQVINVALAQVRSLSLNLHPSILDDLGLAPALRWFADQQAQLGKFSIQVNADSLENRLPAWCEQVCYRVAQEALTNILRHANASHVIIDLWQRGSELHLMIRDDGEGFDIDQVLERANQGNSLGLIGMRERVALVKGTLDIVSNTGSGTEIHARIPVCGELSQVNP